MVDRTSSGEAKGAPSRRSPLFIIVFLLIVVGLVLGGWLWFGRQRSSAGSNVEYDLPKAAIEPLTREASDVVIPATAYPAGSITVISNFETEEDEDEWQGGGVFDEAISYEGRKSLSLISVDHAKVESYRRKPLDLSQMEYIEFMVNISKGSDVEALTIQLGDEELINYYEYQFTNLKDGWNLLQVPKRQFIPVIADETVFDWAGVKRVQFTATSRPDAILIVRLDMVRAINQSSAVLSDWKIGVDEARTEFMSLYEQNGRLRLVARNYGIHMATLDAVKRQTDMIVTALISPQTRTRSGLFIRGNYTTGYGYYFLIDGVRSNSWQIVKLSAKGWSGPEEVVKGDIGNVVFSADKDYWLRVEAEGGVMKFFISFDGKEYYVLGEFKDTEFRSGSAGIAVFDGGWSTFDEFMVKNL